MGTDQRFATAEEIWVGKEREPPHSWKDPLCSQTAISASTLFLSKLTFWAFVDLLIRGHPQSKLAFLLIKELLHLQVRSTDMGVENPRYPSWFCPLAAVLSWLINWLLYIDFLICKMEIINVLTLGVAVSILGTEQMPQAAANIMLKGPLHSFKEVSFRSCTWIFVCSISSAF